MKVIKLRRKWIPHPNSGAKKGYLRLYGPVVKAFRELGPTDMLEVEHGKHIQIWWIKKILDERFPKDRIETINYQKTNGSFATIFKKIKGARKKRKRMGGFAHKERKKKV